MILHHWTGKKQILETLNKATRTKKNNLLLLYQSPQTGGRGIIEFRSEEVAQILTALRSDVVIDDGELFKRFMGKT